MARNAEILRGWYAPRFRVWDAEVLDHMYEHVWHPDIDWRAIEGAPDDVGPMHGRDRLRRYYQEWQELFREIAVEPQEIIEVGDLVVGTFRVTARARSTELPTELSYAVVFTLEGDKMVRGREYATRDEALAAAARESALPASTHEAATRE